MFKVKLYKYDSSQEANGYRGVGENDFSRFVAQGQDVGEDITQILDTGELTLYGLPFQKAFDPETKFILDIVEYGTEVPIEQIVETRHWQVSRDTPNQPILSDNNYFDHHISFVEPSVTAQKRLVDNISATYKLKDVNLEERPAYPDTLASINLSPNTIPITESFTSSLVSTSPAGQKIYKNVLGKRFELEGSLKIQNLKGEDFFNIYNNIENFATDDPNEPYMAKFKIPKLMIKLGNYNSYLNYGYASIDCLIQEFEPNDDLNPIRSWKKEFISNSVLDDGRGGNFSGVNIALAHTWLLESVYGKEGTNASYGAYKKYTELSAPTQTYEINVPIKANKKYKVSISLHQFPDSIPPYADYVVKYTGDQPSYYLSCYTYGFSFSSPSSYVFINEDPYKSSTRKMTSNQTSGSGEFLTYDVETKKVVYASSTPYSAFALLQKAIINSGLYEKENGVYIADVNNSTLPFYIDPDFEDELKSTLIIENFYNQKNLWEIMVEVGNYIHAIPELKFGSNDRYMITFNRLGRTDEEENKSTRVSIYNSRSVEDYISATSSYITNMVQLGGFVEEWVVPKTTNEQLLVSNDTGEILTSKPIIELLDIMVRENRTGRIASLTDFIFEENVYKTLSIDYEVYPNRGIALYYKLGTNVITGGDYQLPQAKTNIYTDYAIKKAIYSAFNGYSPVSPAPISGYWTDLKVNDYSFFIRYRTKDSVRQNHIRPDLRKYLLNSKWDRYPEHNQFNNQTDVVVDSIKFGNNMFGKLIKTGNNSYDIYEWNDKWANVKHKGELYRLNGELYYVAKVTHTIYHNFVISKVSYSKDYNELSNVIGIPSEPRFYEISEQSLIWREFEVNDVLLLTDNEEQLQFKSNYVFNYDHLADLVIGEGTDFAKYAVTVFKGDKDAGKYDQTVGQSDLYIEVINPINAYSSENTLTYEYDMEDNYSAGNKVIETRKLDNVENYVGTMTGTSTPSRQALTNFVVETLSRQPQKDDTIVFVLKSSTSPEITYLYTYKMLGWSGSQIADIEVGREPNKGSYNSLWAVPYTDIYGRASLMDFYILGNIGSPDPTSPSGYTAPTPAEIMAFPESPIDTKDTTKTNFIGNYEILATNVKQFNTDFNGRGIGLLKDCREAMSINYNLRMATSSDTFVLSPYVYLPKKSNVRVVLLAEEVNKLSTGYIDNSKIITPFDKQGNQMNPYFTFDIEKTEITNQWDSTKNVVSKFGVNLSKVFENVADEHFTDTTGYQRVKSIAILCDVSLDAGLDTENPVLPYKTQFIVARNIPDYWNREKALKGWFWGSPNKELVFTNKQ